MLSKIFWTLCAVVAAFMVYVAFLPETSTISRSAVLAAKPEAIFPHVNGLKKWDAWSPWAKLDPAAKSTFDGPDEGVGSGFRWDGNSDVGTGKMTILESEPNKRVKLRLDFEKPMANTSVAEFTFAPEGDGTRVTWTMTGDSPYLTRLICTLMGMDRMVGGMFDKGLASLGAVASAK